MNLHWRKVLGYVHHPLLLLLLSWPLLTMSVVVSEANAMGRLLPYSQDNFSRCGTETADDKFSTGDAQYRIRGKCYVFVNLNPQKTPRDPENIESTFENKKLDHIISWEATGKYTPATKTAEETISVLKKVRPDHDYYFTLGKSTATMECDQDP